MSHDTEDRTIYTDEDDPIPYFYGTVDDYLDRTVLLFGGSGKGKTTVLEDILYKLKSFIPNYLVIAPKTSENVYIKKLPARCIKQDLTKEMLLKIWERQEFITEIYNTANNIDVLSSLFVKCPDRQALIMIKAIAQRAADRIRAIENSNLDFGSKKSQTAHINDLRSKKVKTLYKASIRQTKDKLSRMKLTDEEITALEYLDINPRFMLVVDDCSEKFEMWMKMFKKGEVNPINAIFFRGRWNFITFIFAAHDDKVVDTGLRKNARVTVYCGSKALMASLGKQGSGFTSQEKKLAQRMAGKLFVDEGTGDRRSKAIPTHKKLCYIATDTTPWKYHIADQHPEFRLGATSLYDLVKKMPKVEANLSNNPFLKNLISSPKQSKKKRTPRYAKKKRR